MMKRARFFKIGTSLVTALLLVLSVTVVYAESGSAPVTGGALSVTPANITFAGTTLTGADLTTASTSNAWAAKDPTGTGAGWHLTINSTNFTTDDLQQVYNDASSGTFTLTYDSVESAAIAFNASASVVETAIEGLSNVTAATVTGAGTSANPWRIRFVTDSGSAIMTAGDGSLVGGGSTVTLETVDISVADQQFQITLADGDIGVTAGNTKPTSSVTSKTDIGDSTVTFLTAATDEGMGDYTLNPDFELEIRAESYAYSYSATITVATVSGP